MKKAAAQASTLALKLRKQLWKAWHAAELAFEAQPTDTNYVAFTAAGRAYRDAYETPMQGAMRMRKEAVANGALTK